MSKLDFDNVLGSVIARDHDHYEANRLSSSVQEFLESVFGGAALSGYHAEIQLVCMLLYQCLTLVREGQTPGQEYSNIKLVQEAGNAAARGPNGRKISYFRNPERGTLVQAAVLYAFFPYICARIPQVLAMLQDTISTLLSPEEGLTSSSSSSSFKGNKKQRASKQPNNKNTATQKIDLTITEQNSSNIVTRYATYFSRYLARLFTTLATHSGSAISLLWRGGSIDGHRATDRASIITTIVSMIKNVHDSIYFLHGNYLSLAQRIFGLKFVSTLTDGSKYPAARTKCKPIAWLLCFRVGCLGLYGGRQFIRYLKAILIAVQKRIQEHSKKRAKKRVDKERRTNRVMSDSVSSINDGGVKKKGLLSRSHSASSIQISAVGGGYLSSPGKISRATKSQLDLKEMETYVMGDDTISSVFREHGIARNEFVEIDENDLKSDQRQKQKKKKGRKVRKKRAVSGPVERLPQRCILCMDGVLQPAVTPCGHLFCWDCIVSWGMHTHTDGSVGGGADGQAGGQQHNQYNQHQARRTLGSGPMAKCPVCRHEYAPQSVRAVYGLS
jgi:hypothetical protein